MTNESLYDPWSCGEEKRTAASVREDVCDFMYARSWQLGRWWDGLSPIADNRGLYPVLTFAGDHEIFDQYIQLMRGHGIPGGAIECEAAALCFNMPIAILQKNQPMQCHNLLGGQPVIGHSQETWS